jgi:hypothetical protein
MPRLDDEIGMLKPGVVANASVLHDEPGGWVLCDRNNEDYQVNAARLLLRPAVYRLTKRRALHARLPFPIAFHNGVILCRVRLRQRRRALWSLSPSRPVTARAGATPGQVG